MENTLEGDIFETTRLLKAWSEGDEAHLGVNQRNQLLLGHLIAFALGLQLRTV